VIERLFGALVAASIRRPRRVLAIGAVVVAACAWHASAHLELRTSNLDLVDPDLPEVRRFTDVAREFGTPNVLVVVLEGPAPGPLRAAVDRCAPLLAKAPGVRVVLDRLPLDEASAQAAGLERYLLSDDGRLAFLMVQPDDPRSRAETLGPFVQGVRDALTRADLGALGVHAGLTGTPAYALDDRDVLQHDISRLSAIAGVLELLLLVAVFGSFVRPALAAGTLVASLTVVLGLATTAPGHLTLLSSFFVSIALGEGIDFALHLFGRTEELAREGVSELDALPRAARSLARGMGTTVLTTSGIFLAMTLSGFRGFAELGIVAAFTLPVCLLASLTLLPAALAIAHLRPPRARWTALPFLRRVLGRRAHPALAVAVALACVAGLFAWPGFDRDYLHLEPARSEAVRLEREMVGRSRLSPDFAVFVTPDREHAIDLADRLLREDVVGEVASIGDLEALEDASTPVAVAWRRAFESPSGRCAVYAHPQGDAWDPAVQARFVDRMRRLDPEVTGMPFLGRFMVQRSLRALAITGALSLVIVFGCAWLDLRSVRLTLLAGLPTVLTLGALHGALSLLRLEYDPLSVMALPIVVGYAVDDAVHVLHRLRAEAGDVARALAGAGTSVVLTSATTVVSFGALAFTQHRGLAHFAVTLTLGVTLALLVSIVVLPVLASRVLPRSET
jgi:predicted RND superfamily exporter protein